MTGLFAPTRWPDPYDPARGADVQAKMGWPSGDFARLVAGTAGCSPYLAGLLGKESVWLEGAAADPQAAVEDVLDGLSDAPDLARDLRQAKRRLGLLTALADLGGIWPLERVTATLTRLADRAVDLALRHGLQIQVARGKLDPKGEAGGIVAMAMGKMGAFELNYSSDIDLICLFDDSRYPADDVGEVRAALVRATRTMATMLSDQTADGYVFRTDLRLRPDPAVTPVCVAMGAAEQYYETLGRTWERAAWVKARPAGGDLASGQAFLQSLRPFVWRRHLDFAAIRDAHDIRLRIREHKRTGGPITLPGHNLKLGRGGIREIEFFTQTRQIIAGGRDPDLRKRGTLNALAQLVAKGWVAPDVAGRLEAHYRALREMEHRLQMLQDAQRHDLPRSDAGFAQLAAFTGQSVTALKQDLADRLADVHALTEDFFAPEAPAASHASKPEIDGSDAIMAGWPRYPALRSDRAAKIFERLRPDILARLARADKPQEALVAFDRFLAGLPAGVQLFSLFESNPSLVDLLAEVVSVGPELAGYLSRNSGVFDAVIDGDFFAEWPGRTALTAELDGLLAQESDYERKLDVTRRWCKEIQFRIGVHLLRGVTRPETCARQYADLARAALSALWPAVIAQFAAKHGAPPGRGAAILGMGSLGAGRLNARSDLDLIVIYDDDGQESSDGPRPLAARTYYARLTQALVTAVSAPTAEGKLYEVDMRLRPSGNQGPVATSFAAFQSYQRTEAWGWEHMALTRAEAIAGPAGMIADIEAFRQSLLASRAGDTAILQDLRDMRERIAAAKSGAADWEVKLGAGRMQDIELFAQAALVHGGNPGRTVLDGLAAARTAGWLDAGEDEMLARTYQLTSRVQLASKLLGRAAVDPAKAGAGTIDFLLRLSDCQDQDDLDQALRDLSARSAAIIDRLAGPRGEKE